MTAVINGSSPTVTFSDGTTQATAFTGSAATLTSGTLPAARLPAGSVLQVVTGTLATAASTSSTTFVDSGLQATITPSSASSKIFISITTVCGLSNFLKRVYFQVSGGNTASYVGVSGTGRSCSMAITPRVDGGGYPMMPVALSYLDSPATASAITYKLQYAVESETAWLNRPNTQDAQGANLMSTITLMEIAA